MASQHTPGPWTIRDGGFIDGEGFFCLATVRAAHVPYEPEAIANARLIAATPDLLVALKAMVEPYEGLDAAGIQKTSWPHTVKVVMAARATIAKAEG